MHKRLLVGGLILTLLITGCTQPSVETQIPASASEAPETPSQTEITEPSQTSTPPVKTPEPMEAREATSQNGTTSIEGKERESSDNVSGPVLSNDLVRSITHTRRSGDFDNVGLSIGETAIDFTLTDVDGNTVNLRGLLSEKPVVMVFGSFT